MAAYTVEFMFSVDWPRPGSNANCYAGVWDYYL